MPEDARPALRKVVSYLTEDRFESDDAHILARTVVANANHARELPMLFGGGALGWPKKWAKDYRLLVDPREVATAAARMRAQHPDDDQLREIVSSALTECLLAQPEINSERSSTEQGGNADRAPITETRGSASMADPRADLSTSATDESARPGTDATEASTPGPHGGGGGGAARPPADIGNVAHPPRRATMPDGATAWSP